MHRFVHIILVLLKNQKNFFEATKDHQENLFNYLDLQLLIEKKVNCMKRWRIPIATAKKY